MRSNYRDNVSKRLFTLNLGTIAKLVFVTDPNTVNFIEITIFHTLYISPLWFILCHICTQINTCRPKTDIYFAPVEIQSQDCRLSKSMRQQWLAAVFAKVVRPHSVRINNQIFQLTTSKAQWFAHLFHNSTVFFPSLIIVSPNLLPNWIQILCLVFLHVPFNIVFPQRRN